MKMVTVVGARPQFIKAAAVSRAIQAFNQKYGLKKKIQEILIHTGQHYDYSMDRIFFEELKLPNPDYHLGVGSGSHAQQTAGMLERIERVLQKEKPHVLMVYGDTNSTLAGALTAAKFNIPVAHVEAGLRSYNRIMPEEVNRILTDHLSTFLFCPTNQAVNNLSKEGIIDRKRNVVEKVGDVMYDSVLYYSEIAEKKSTILKDLNLIISNGSLIPKSAFRIPNYYLATLHRAENTDSPNTLKSILRGLNEIGKNVPVILPLHPRTKKRIKAYRLFPETKNIKLIGPVSYLNMLKLERNAKAILTDSGGVQKEAYWFGIPCFTLRDETEWLETLQSGWNVLVGTDKKRIVEEIKHREERKGPAKKRRVFGDGRTSERIIQILTKWF